MKFLPVVSFCFIAALYTNFTYAQKKQNTQVKKPAIKNVEIAPFVFNRSLWEANISDFQSNPSNKKYKFKWQSEMNKTLRSEGLGSVSYTHLTLPTIYSV